MQTYEEVVEGYYMFLNGSGENFPKETIERIKNFSTELDVKRSYNKFTIFKSNLDEMIIINGLKLFSFCEHHLLPYFGFASVGYIPNGHILGLSKFQRIVDKLSSSCSLQENLTSEIAQFIEQTLSPKGIGVAVTALHTCMYGRGINTSTATVNTQVLRGMIKEEPDTRNEFLKRITHEHILR